MNRRDFLKKLFIYGGTLGTLGLAGKLLGRELSIPGQYSGQSGSISLSEGVANYYRIVVLGDPHLPVREREVADSGKRQRIIAAKHKVAEDINAWDDVNQVSVLGDIVAQFGNEAEYAYAKQYFSRFNKKVSLIAGNHDYIYTDAFSPAGKFVLADADSRKRKLARFTETFQMSALSYSQQVDRYLLIFLSPDSLDSLYLTRMSDQQLSWFSGELQKYPAAPTIVFFHAPLANTLHSYNKHANAPDFIAQPEKKIAKIISDNPQIILWVSGHMHTPATNPSYASSINTFGKRVTNIHNTDMDRETIWTNSLYLYSNRVLIKTFNHKKKIWEQELERTVYV